jgi:hypothetical protein
MFCQQELCVVDFHLAVLHEHSEFPVERRAGKCLKNRKGIKPCGHRYEENKVLYQPKINQLSKHELSSVLKIRIQLFNIFVSLKPHRY